MSQDETVGVAEDSKARFASVLKQFFDLNSIPLTTEPRNEGIAILQQSGDEVGLILSGEHTVNSYKIRLGNPQEPFYGCMGLFPQGVRDSIGDLAKVLGFKPKSLVLPDGLAYDYPVLVGDSPKDYRVMLNSDPDKAAPVTRLASGYWGFVAPNGSMIMLSDNPSREALEIGVHKARTRLTLRGIVYGAHPAVNKKPCTK